MIFHVMISASLLEGATHHFCFFAFFRLTVLPPSSCHWLFAESIPIAACIHFHIARKWPGSKSRFLRCICGGFLKQGYSDFQRIFHSKPSSDPHWNPRSMSFWPKKLAQKVRAGGRVGLGAVAEVSGHFLRKWTGWMAMDSIRIQRLSMA